MKYKVSFSGFAYIEADSPEEAEEKAMYEDDSIYEEKKCESMPHLRTWAKRPVFYVQLRSLSKMGKAKRQTIRKSRKVEGDQHGQAENL